MTSSTQSRKLTLVTGSSGTTGRRVAQRLAERGVPTRLGSRSGSPAFDWADEATWPAVLDGVVAAYLVYYPDLVAPGAVDTVRRFAEFAVSSGVRRLVLLSGRGEEEAQRAEQAVMDSGADWTIVRCAFFAQNFSEKGFEEFVRAGTVALPAPEIGEPFVDAEDIADVVVTALTEDGHSGELYELTGPRLMTFADSVAEIATATGRDIDYQTISSQEFIAGLVEQGLPKEEATVFAEIFDTVLDGRGAFLTNGVQRALGRPPRDFAEYARHAAATGVWNA
ncbi:MAG TPA: NmrA family transcriptional regulator [Pseudonocardia sp.]|uniref:NmrA family transcriptional regulator n=1 Tax=Pseudonocardia sp. TaxID=60912 RepID=UPI002BF54502|nr:NmrA family transcriptional regulator [Pseudonocardia sp.]HTF52853.1 NmrA family transcriptional regulator [Pseudonocardia sp.]